MTFAAVTLLGLTMGQPLGPDYYTMKKRDIKIPIEYTKDRKSIRQVLLYVSRNGENTWYQVGAVTPDKDSFVYIAQDDGVYWFKMQLVDLKGEKDPADLTRDPPDLKVVIDTTAPQIRVTNAKRNGEEVVIEWTIDEKFPHDAETKVHFRPTDNTKGYWQEVTIPANSRTGVKFPCRTMDAITVRITAVDVAGNRTEVTKDFPAAGVERTTSLSSPGGSGANAGTNAGIGTNVQPPLVDLTPSGPIAPIGAGPLSPVGPAPILPPAPAPIVTPSPTTSVTPTPPVITPTTPTPAPPSGSPYPPVAGNTQPNTPQPLPTIDPKAPPTGVLPTQGGAPATDGWTGASNPAVELPRPQVISYTRFDLGFDLEKRGPSGISRVDLWVTRDEGRSWRLWPSQYDGRAGVVRVALDVRDNTQLEGNYGFRLVPVSGAGLSEREPAAGDAPDLRVVLDTTPPNIFLYPPVSDPNATDTLLLQWKATDRNFSDDPITLEWSESPTGPWKPVSTGNEPVAQAGATNTPVAKRLANTGQYAWRVPVGVPAHVYLKASARDAAGNVKEVVTRDAIPVDLTRPRAKINGIAPTIPLRP